MEDAHIQKDARGNVLVNTKGNVTCETEGIYCYYLFKLFIEISKLFI